LFKVGNISLQLPLHKENLTHFATDAQVIRGGTETKSDRKWYV